MTHEPEGNAQVAKPRGRVLSGRRVVLGMAAFGLLMTGGMFLYWELYTRPFRPLQNAIAARFPKSSPRVVAGRYKSQDPKSPLVLRMIVQTKVDPRKAESEMRRMANELVAIAAAKVDVRQYDQVEVYLVHRPPEAFTVTWSVTAPENAFPLPLEGALPKEAIVEVQEGNEGS